MIMSRTKLSAEEYKVEFHLGGLWSEVNTILRRISRRRSGEPTARERTRLAELKTEIDKLRNGWRS